ncbi:hypothetical protein CPB84DRAFT_1757515 [Gymnopilus junonius]|uniref:Small ribosomal subunit protein bS18m n=1 Tax=Gymnopilus junonius TaxID=109634 RepID=A0A9P5TU28_GYMJU|nr:hypothetical protein CPB84DRAFT_1757515 [Gymnopilus junonius]
MLAATRPLCRRSFATNTKITNKDWATPVSDILKNAAKSAPASPKAPKRVSKQSYRLFHPDQIITERALTFDTCTRTRPPSRGPAVAPPPSVARAKDIFHQLNLDPRDFSTNPYMLSFFVTEMGKIKGRDQTMLTLKNQRLLGRTIRRAKMMGVIPNLSKY